MQTLTIMKIKSSKNSGNKSGKRPATSSTSDNLIEDF